MKKLTCIFLLLLTVLTVVFSNDIIENVKITVNLCLYTVIPSLFPFLVFSRMMVLSGAAAYVGKILHPVTGRIFSLSKKGSFVFLIGIICGYPVGAKCASDMVKNGEISLNEGKRLILFCNNSGPLFVIGAIGYGMFSDIRYGVILYIAHLLSAFTIGIITRSKTTDKEINERHSSNPYFTQSVEEAVITVLNISGYIIFFSAICTIIKDILPDKLNFFKNIIIVLTEITGGIKSISDAYSLSISAKLIVASFLLGFGGICIIFQTKSVITNSGIPIMPYVLSKICQGTISVIYIIIILSLYPVRTCSHNFGYGFTLSPYMLIVSLGVIVVYFFKNFRKK